MKNKQFVFTPGSCVLHAVVFGGVYFIGNMIVRFVAGLFG